MLEDIFYDSYCEKVQKKDAGKFTGWQLLLCWLSLGVAIGGFILGAVSADYQEKDMMWLGIIVMTVSLFFLFVLVQECDRKRLTDFYTKAINRRKDSMLSEIEEFFGEKAYIEKIDYLIELYKNALEKREVRGRAKTASVTAWLTCAVGLISMAGNTEKGFAILVGTSVVLIILSLAAGMIIRAYVKATDNKAKMYDFMIKELNSVKLMIKGEAEESD